MPVRVFGRGSNLYVASPVVEGVVVRTTALEQDLQFDGNRVKAGAGVPLQRLLLLAAQHGLGGLDYLHSVPGNVGGAIFMNAGRGPSFRQAIGDKTVQVEFLHKNRVRVFSRQRCRFAHRRSVFHDLRKAVIISAELELEPIEPAIAKQRLTERIRFTKDTQDNTRPNAGSVFCKGLALGDELRGLRIGDTMFSRKTSNWILNLGGPTSDDLQLLLQECDRRHLEKGYKPPELEWTKW